MTRGNETDDRAADIAGLSRRTILTGAVAGFVMTASGVLLTVGEDEAEAREGVYDGQLGGRHGNNRRGREKRKPRDHGKHKDKRDPNPPPRGGLLRDVAIYVHNLRNVPIEVQGWQGYPTGPNPGGDWYMAFDDWAWSTLAAKPTTGMEHFKDFVANEIRLAVQIGPAHVVVVYNDWASPGGSAEILSGGWDAQHGWNPKGESLASRDKMGVDAAIEARLINVKRLHDTATHQQYLVNLK
jgi:hypothetical protein